MDSPRATGPAVRNLSFKVACMVNGIPGSGLVWSRFGRTKARLRPHRRSLGNDAREIKPHVHRHLVPVSARSFSLAAIIVCFFMSPYGLDLPARAVYISNSARTGHAGGPFWLQRGESP
jgi:hypothetical protein